MTDRLLSTMRSDERIRIVDALLAKILPTLKEPSPTGYVAMLAADMFGIAKFDKPERQVMARQIIKAAPRYPCAKRSEETFHKYGREMRRWIWSPLKKDMQVRDATIVRIEPTSRRLQREKAEKQSALAQELLAGAVVDDSDW